MKKQFEETFCKVGIWVIVLTSVYIVYLVVTNSIAAAQKLAQAAPAAAAAPAVEPNPVRMRPEPAPPVAEPGEEDEPETRQPVVTPRRPVVAAASRPVVAAVSRTVVVPPSQPEVPAPPAPVAETLHILPSTTIARMSAAEAQCAAPSETETPKRNRARRIFGFVPGLIAKPFRKGREERADLRVQSQVIPLYPQDAFERNTQGTVRLCVAVDPDGAVRDVRALDGPEALTTPAVEALKQWQYEPFAPAKDQDRAWSEVTVRFTLVVGQ